MIKIQNDRLLDRIKVSYRLQDIQAISDFLTTQGSFHFPTLANGLFSAALLSRETEYTGYSNVWVRDNIHVAHACSILGKTNVAIKNLACLMTYFKKYRNRFENIIESKVDPAVVMERPHIRFNGQTLAEIGQKWAHAQNDALGYFLWFYCQLACEGLLNLQPEDWAMLLLFPLYFEAIRYWADEDSGHWEEARKVEASSIGTVVAGLRELQKLMIKLPVQGDCQYPHKTVDAQFLADLIEQGTAALNRILPWECIQPKHKRRRYDAALLFLIYPLQIVESEMANRILADTIENLQGEYGIKRYLNDSFWSADYKTKLSPEVRTDDFSEDMSARDALVQPGEEAQWCIFDPIVSAIFGLKFQQTQCQDYFEQQTFYLNRSLGQLTGKDCRFGEFKCPELYYLEDGRYVPNDVTPLLWTQANLSIALKMMERSIETHCL